MVDLNYLHRITLNLLQQEFDLINATIAYHSNGHIRVITMFTLRVDDYIAAYAYVRTY